MKITIVAFDLWGFNKKIADHLIANGHEVTFIDSNAIRYIYKNNGERIMNFINKLFFKRNIKKDYLNKKMIEIIENLPTQDTIFIVNPKQFRPDILDLLRDKTNKFIAHNYDSLSRIPLPDNANILFDKIYSFDIDDVKKNKFLNNFFCLF